MSYLGCWLYVYMYIKQLTELNFILIKKKTQIVG